MGDKIVYRLSSKQKEEIAQNLIEILRDDAEISKQTVTFVCNWILTGPNEKRKAFFDVWDMVLKNYLPSSRPILFRSCRRRNEGEISSFTGRLECARRFSDGRGFLLICDTKEALAYEEHFYKQGEYRHTFYPLVNLLKQAQNSRAKIFSESFLNDYIGEDEYVMRVDLGNMETFKWYREVTP